MGLIRKIILILTIILTFMLSGCNLNYSKVNLYGVEISQVKATTSSAYFLSEDGTLYCTGTDSDASSYAIYEDREKGIVAKNVREFGEVSGGGYYIDNDNNLYYWNKQNQPMYNYKKGSIELLLKNIQFAKIRNYCMVFLDDENNLYLVGELGPYSYEINSPKLLSKNVLSADTNGSFVLWHCFDGTMNSFGDCGSFEIEKLKDFCTEKEIQEIEIFNNYILITEKNNLWFYGDFDKFLGSDGGAKKDNFQLLSSNVAMAKGSQNAIIALDLLGNAKLWGKSLINNSEETEEPKYSYLSDYTVSNNAIYVYVSGGCVCYVDKQHNSKIYHSSGWAEFYGNSTYDEYVGINREPVTWVSIQ